MKRRLLSLTAGATACATVWAMTSTQVFTQTKSSKTPWGEPDLIGVWSSDDTAGIPMSRPQNFGDRLYQTDEEFATRTKNITQRAKQGDENAVGAFRFDYARRA